ncbi:MAG: hypothetical protein R3362_07635, partial [Rhodothermales bacterium]|nr:hypothetical protein [Rhodothermales bacterium]
GSATHGLTATAPALTQTHGIAVLAAAHAPASEAPILVRHLDLGAPGSATHALTAAAPVLSSVHGLTPGASVSQATADAAAITGLSATLAPGAVVQAQTAAAVGILGDIFLFPADVRQDVLTAEAWFLLAAASSPPDRVLSPPAERRTLSPAAEHRTAPGSSRT